MSRPHQGRPGPGPPRQARHAALPPARARAPWRIVLADAPRSAPACAKATSSSRSTAEPVATWDDFTTDRARERRQGAGARGGARRPAAHASRDTRGAQERAWASWAWSPRRSCARPTTQWTPPCATVPWKRSARRSRRSGTCPIFSVKMLGRMIVGDVSWKNLSGPDHHRRLRRTVGAARMDHVAGLPRAREREPRRAQSAARFPLLDGGHLVYYFAEIVKGSPVSERTMEIGQRFGLAFLVGLTVLRVLQRPQPPVHRLNH